MKSDYWALRNRQRPRCIVSQIADPMDLPDPREQGPWGSLSSMEGGWRGIPASLPASRIDQDQQA